MQKRKCVLIIYRAWYPNIQYLFDQLQESLPYEVNFFLLSSKERGRPWEVAGNAVKVHPRIIPGYNFHFFSRDVILNRGLNRYLSELSPDLIIIGTWSEAGCFIAKHFGKTRGIPTISWIVGRNDMYLPHLIWRIRKRVSCWLERKFIKKAAFVFAEGTKARNDAIKLGARKDRVIIVKHTICEDHFDYRNKCLYQAEIALERKRLKAKGPLFLSIAQLIPRKGIDILLKAFSELLKRVKDAQLLLIGSGPMQRIVMDFKDEYAPNFYWIPSVPYERIPIYYFMANYAILPSYFDDWGNVVNESHCAKIPIICSDGVVASYDLIKDGYNGLIFKAGNADSLAELMIYAVTHPEEMQKMAQRGYEFIQETWNTNEAVKIWSKYIGMVLESS